MTNNEAGCPCCGRPICSVYTPRPDKEAERRARDKVLARIKALRDQCGVVFGKDGLDPEPCDLPRKHEGSHDGPYQRAMVAWISRPFGGRHPG